MKRNLILLLESMLADASVGCRISTTLDLKKIKSRVEREGISFLTISLANFGTDFNKSLDQGFVGPSQFVGFRRIGGLPLMLGGFLDHVFDRKSGRLLADPCVNCVREIRQLTLAFSKINLECSSERRDAAVRKYLAIEEELKQGDGPSPSLEEAFSRLTSLVLGQFLSNVDLRIYEGEPVPKHGPGATADLLRGNAKWMQSEWPERLEREFPSLEFLSPSPRYWKVLERVKYLTPEQERPVKVLLVPKTLKTPRIIAKEPTAMMYAQMAIHSIIQDELDHPDTRPGRDDSLVSAMIGYSSQTPNQRLARDSSRDGSLATLDLSEASDRVSNQLVRLLLRRHPNLFRAVDACRSRKADVPGHGVIRLAKFASMGSGLCFPFESMVFLSIVLVGIERSRSRRLSYKDIESLKGQVRIYGDDIIVPVDTVHSVIETLSDFGLKVNLDKSFWTGRFRESCGGDYYAGHDVGVVRIRSVLPTSRKHVPEIVSTVSTRNQFYFAGYWRTARFLDSLLERLIPFPVVSEQSQVLGRHSFLLGPVYGAKTKWSATLHTPLVKGCVVQVRLPASRLGDHFALLKCLTNSSDLPIADVRHLERAGRPFAVDIKQRLVSPY